MDLMEYFSGSTSKDPLFYFHVLMLREFFGVPTIVFIYNFYYCIFRGLFSLFALVSASVVCFYFFIATVSISIDFSYDVIKHLVFTIGDIHRLLASDREVILNISGFILFFFFSRWQVSMREGNAVVARKTNMN